MRKLVVVSGVALIASISAVVVFGQARMAHGEVTVLVVDEANRPLTDAAVAVRFNQPRSRNPWDGLKGKHVEGDTDADGRFTAASKTVRKILVAARKPGYYTSQISYEFTEQENADWLPRNPTLQVVLREKADPVAMYAKRLYDIALPVAGTPVGYDLIEGDWVEPHGRGTIQDLVLELTREFRSRKDFDSTLVLTAPRQGDGFAPIIDVAAHTGSEMQLPAEATRDGYVDSIRLTYSSDPAGGYRRTISPEAANFFLRIRSKTGDAGEVESALFGKLVGPIEYRIQESTTANLRVAYYVNPDGTRNVEFDPQRNLFENLARSEQVRQP